MRPTVENHYCTLYSKCIISDFFFSWFYKLRERKSKLLSKSYWFLVTFNPEYSSNSTHNYKAQSAHLPEMSKFQEVTSILFNVSTDSNLLPIKTN